jgi:hydrogenase nickel incorporation protein HypA/HybF
MHEYSIVSSLLDRVQHEVTARNGIRVHRLWVRIGELSGVEIELLQTAYDLCRVSTVCEHAPMEVSRQDARWECPQCGTPVGRGMRLSCDRCGRPARLVQGDEIMLDRIEMEVA